MIDFILDAWWLVGIIALPVAVFLFAFIRSRNAQFDTDLWGPEAHLMHSHPETQAEILARHPELGQAIDDYRAGRPWNFSPEQAAEVSVAPAGLTAGGMEIAADAAGPDLGLAMAETGDAELAIVESAVADYPQFAETFAPEFPEFTETKS